MKFIFNPFDSSILGTIVKEIIGKPSTPGIPRIPTLPTFSEMLLRKSPIGKRIQKYGYEAGFKDGFIKESEVQAVVFERLKNNFSDILARLKKETDSKNKSIDIMLDRLEEYEKDLRMEVSREKRKQVKSDSSIRNMDIAGGVSGMCCTLPGSIDLIDVALKIYYDGKQEGKEDGARKARRIFREKIVSLKDDFEKCKKKYEKKLMNLDALINDIQEELYKYY